MNVRIHKRDFSHEDYLDVELVKESWGGDRVVLEDSNFETIADVVRCDVTSIEIRI